VTQNTPGADPASAEARAYGVRSRVADEVDRTVVRVVVKVRYVPFTTRTRSRTLPAPTTEGSTIEQATLEALDRLTTRRPVRLLGVRAEFRN